MALTSPYANVGEYRKYIDSQSADGGDDATISRSLTSVSRWLDAKLGRMSTGFGKADSATAREFRVHSQHPILFIDDLSAAPTALKIDWDQDGTFEQSYTSSDYTPEPVNAADYPEPLPFTRLRAKSNGSIGTWPRDLKVEVTGVWGWPSVPGSIKEATLEFTAIWSRQSVMATERIPEGLDAAIQAAPVARMMLHGLIDRFRRYDAVAV